MGRRTEQPPPAPLAERAMLEQRCKQLDRRLGVLAAAGDSDSRLPPLIERVRRDAKATSDPAERLTLLEAAADDSRALLPPEIAAWALPRSPRDP